MAVYKLSAAGGVGTARTNYNSFLAGNPKFVPPSYESIATVTVGSGGSSSIDFTSIPNTYTHLQIRSSSRTDRAVALTYYKMQFNNDTSSVYAYHAFYGNGATVGVDKTTSDSWATINRFTGTSALSSVFAPIIIDILDYKNTNKYKTTKSIGGADLNGSGEIWYQSGLWQNTNAITSIKLTDATGSNFVQYSHFALYGIKGS